MQIEISVEGVEPLTGTAAHEDSTPVPFVGWLGLLRALSALLEVVPEVAGRDGPQLSTGRHVELRE